jgi:hypothetical protein
MLPHEVNTWDLITDSRVGELRTVKRNPNWTTDKLILALDLYFRAGRKRLDGAHQDVINLSELLHSLPSHNPNERGRN